MDMKLEVLFIPVSDIPGQALLRETGISFGYRLRRKRELPGDTVHSSQF